MSNEDLNKLKSDSMRSSAKASANDFDNFQDFTVEETIPDDRLNNERPKAENSPRRTPDVPKERESTARKNNKPDESFLDMDFVEFTIEMEDSAVGQGISFQNQTQTQTQQNIKASLSSPGKIDLENESQLPVRVSPRPDASGDEPKYKSEIARRKSEIKILAEDADSEAEAEGRKNRMGDKLVAMGIITPDQLNVALQEQKITGKMIGEVLVGLGFIDEETLSVVLAESAGFDVFDPMHTIVDGDTLALIKKEIAQKYHILPISIVDGQLFVAMSDPYDVLALDALRRFVPRGISIKPVVTSATVLLAAIDAAYGYSSSIQEIMKELEQDKGTKDIVTLKENESFTHPIVRLVNALVFDAVKLGVSDLHFEPEEHFVRLRYRLDGVLFTAQILHKQHWNGISQRLKLMSEMNIADKLSPQDGRFRLNVGGREADFRVSSLPTVFGENIVLRVLDKSSSIMPLEKLGFSKENMNKIERSQSKPEGIIIVTGPTGSGKTTSLYSMLNKISTVEVNIQTLEDPVEYSLPMIRQTHVRTGILDFADGIKAMLRQDPDIIFIGEIRDQTTAEMALKAAMTGHQVYTTLHTNDSFGAIPRLLDLGLKPGMISGAIIAVFAQRLTRRLCQNCKEPYRPTADECRILAINANNPPTIFRAHPGGCDMCKGQGYKGRVAVVEILTFDEDMDELLARSATKADLKMMAEKKGFKSMKDDGILKILEGLTSLEALSRVVDINK
jgi:general secretion pathway protein E/type IV pilus assembly protein PilB